MVNKTRFAECIAAVFQPKLVFSIIEIQFVFYKNFKISSTYECGSLKTRLQIGHLKSVSTNDSLMFCGFRGGMVGISLYFGSSLGILANVFLLQEPIFRPILNKNR